MNNLFKLRKTTERWLFLSAMLLSSTAFAATEIVDSIHFIIPGGIGGGWDGTARGTGEALRGSGLVGNVTYENMSGEGGGKAIAYLIDNASDLDEALMVNSTPIIIRSLTKVFPQNFRDLTLIAGTIGDYQALVVPRKSKLNTMNKFVSAFKKNPSKMSIGGGSVPGGLDHLVAAMIVEAIGENPRKLKYVSYDGEGGPISGLLSGKFPVLSTGFSEAVTLAKARKVKIIGVTAGKRVVAYRNAKTMKEQGVDVTFVNWRGFFAAPDISASKVRDYRKIFAEMYKTEEWEKVRKRNGWVNIYNPGYKFATFLIEQEEKIGNLMKKLGFL